MLMLFGVFCMLAWFLNDDGQWGWLRALIAGRMRINANSRLIMSTPLPEMERGAFSSTRHMIVEMSPSVTAAISSISGETIGEALQVLISLLQHMLHLIQAIDHAWHSLLSLIHFLL